MLYLGPGTLYQAFGSILQIGESRTVVSVDFER